MGNGCESGHFRFQEEKGKMRKKKTAKGPPEGYDCSDCCYRNRYANLCFPCLAKIIDELKIWEVRDDRQKNGAKDHE